MVGEGIEPASIEQAGSQAGYPAAPLQLSDELNLKLMHKIAAATRKGVEDAGGTCEPHPAEAVVDKMIEHRPPGRGWRRRLLRVRRRQAHRPVAGPA